jgi:hypothetical protein
VSKYFIIANPAAGRGARERAVPKVENLLMSHDADFQVVQTERPWHEADLGSTDPALEMISPIQCIFPMTWKSPAKFWSSDHHDGSTLGAYMGADGQRLEIELFPKSLAVICCPLNSG